MPLVAWSLEVLSYSFFSALNLLGHSFGLLALPLQSVGFLIPEGGMTGPGCQTFHAGNDLYVQLVAVAFIIKTENPYGSYDPCHSRFNPAYP